MNHKTVLENKTRKKDLSLTSNANVYTTFGRSENVFETSELTLTLLYYATHCTLMSFFPGVVSRHESG